MKTRPHWVNVHRYSGLANIALPATVDQIENLSAFFEGLAAALIPQWVTKDKPFETVQPARCVRRSNPHAQARGKRMGLNASEINVFGLPYRILSRSSVTETSLMPDSASTRD
ncbi:hypothetical protein [Methylomonas methanica]|uniref:Uncharacterized protein n=1 Tax=Methylomonas methanica (strain DSM 25384 / MC09) TaxID=857087 RepID=F9ZWN0_METMM|nr:hypothetical protein [Methylomonas methanica]AEG00877.1 hypothetical protein Metme_2482 [Methylomonas methanica MC09]